MLRTIVIVAAAGTLAVSSTPGAFSTRTRPAPPSDSGTTAPLPTDVAALMAAAHGTPSLMCALAARTISNGWESGTHVPAPPLGREAFAQYDGSRTDRLSSDDVLRLFGALEAKDPCVREFAVRIISQQDSARVAPGLIERLSAADPATRAVAAMGLGLLHSNGAARALTMTLRDAVAAVRANAAWALGRIRQPATFGALLPLVRDSDPLVREAAIGAVGQMDSTRAEAQLTQVLLHDDVPRVRRAAAWALGRFRTGAAAVATALATALAHDSDATVREMAAWALARDGEGAAGIPALSNALRSDTNDRVRETAAWALGNSHGSSASDALISTLENDRSERVRATAAWALGSLRDDDGTAAGNTRAVAALTGVLSDSSARVRLRAAWALGQIATMATPSSVPALNNALAHEQNDEVRRALVRVLTRLGGLSSDALAPLLNSSDPRTREMAVRALAGRGGIDPWPWPQPRPRPFP